MTPAELAALRAIHPTSNVEALYALPAWRLRLTLFAARDLYNGGHAHARGYANARLDMVREVLELRARFAAMPREERARLEVGNRTTGLPKTSCLFSFHNEPVGVSNPIAAAGPSRAAQGGPSIRAGRGRDG